MKIGFDGGGSVGGQMIVGGGGLGAWVPPRARIAWVGATWPSAGDLCGRWDGRVLGQDWGEWDRCVCTQEHGRAQDPAAQQQQQHRSR